MTTIIKKKRGRPACEFRLKARQEAQALGKVNFVVPQEAKGCSKCGGREFRTANNTCTACRAERHQPAYRATPAGKACDQRSSAAQWERIKSNRD